MPLFTLDPGALPSGYAEDLLPLADVKVHLRVDGTEEDMLIGWYRDAAIQLIEKLAEMAFGPRDACVAQDVRIERDGSACLGLWPIRSIVSIAGYDSAGDALTIDVADFVTRRDRIMPGEGRSWPSALPCGATVTVTFDAGAETAEDARARYSGLLLAALRMLAYLYANREGGGPDGEVPPGVLAVVNSYRPVRL